MDLSQQSDKLQSLEKVIQFCQEKKKLVLLHLLYRAIFKLYFQVKFKCYDIFFLIKLLGESTEQLQKTLPSPC